MTLKYDPTSLQSLFNVYQNWLKIRNYSPLTLTRLKSELGLFMSWSEEMGVNQATEVTSDLLSSYKRRLTVKRNSQGKTNAISSIMLHLGSIRTFFRWMVRHDHLWAQGFRYHYPLALLRITILAYRAARYVCYAGLRADPISPLQCIVAGCCSATAELKLVLITAVH